jgi:murein DD-endopeptidase MepM/ murein hydrolase activator NlpD
MSEKLFRLRLMILLAILSFCVACAPEVIRPTSATFHEGMDLTRSAAPSENGIVPATVSASWTMTSTAVPPTVTLTPTDTSTHTAAFTDTETPTPTRKTFVYVFPVRPKEIADFAEGGHAYPATDIFVPVGTEFVAVTDGVVDFVSYKDLWDPATNDQAVAGGLCVAIVGDDGVRYYGSHLSAIAKGISRGVRVQAGQRLGLSGKTGNARNTTPHVHFGISHPTYPEDWATRRGELDPYPYLLAWRRGENITPQFSTPTITATASST